MFGIAGAGVPNPQLDAQVVCTELARRMEELYPILQQASGDRNTVKAAAGAAAQNGFVAYTYSFSANPQVLQQANSGQFNPQQHMDVTKWAQALQNNPDPQSCYPEALVGLPALEQRLQFQQKAVEQCNGALEELRQGFGNLKDHLQAQSFQRLEDCKKRQRRLERQLLQVVAALERRALEVGGASRNLAEEVRLDGRLAQLEEVVAAPGGARARVDELWAVLRGLRQRGPLPGGPQQLSEADAERVLSITARQGELLEQLGDELSRRRRDVTQFENALLRFLTSGGAQGVGGMARPTRLF